MKPFIPCALLLIGSTWAQLPSEDFSLGNTNQWTLNDGAPVPHDVSGGFPGGCLNVGGFGVNSTTTGLTVDVLRPTLPGHGFSGDFRAMDVRYLQVSFSVIGGVSLSGDEWAVYVADDNGTPTIDDDAFLVGGFGFFIQNPQSWIPVGVSIPSTFANIPNGWWTVVRPGNPMFGMDHNSVWNAIITDVDYVGIGGDIGASLPLGSLDVLFDNIALTGPPDPWGSFCYPGNASATGSPVTLTGGISPQVNSSVHLDANNGPPGEFGYVLVGSAKNEPGIQLGNGLLCLGQGPGDFIGRYNIQGTPMNSLGVFDSAGTFQNLSGTSSNVGDYGFDVPHQIPVAGSPTFQSGETWYFQLWYRETGPGTSNSNLSNGFQFTFL